MLQPVGFDRLIIEPGAVTSLPFVATGHAELCCAPTSHMVASFLELDHSRTIVAALPAFLLGHFNENLRCRILRAVPGRVHLGVAYAANPCPASFAFAYLATILKADVIRFDPLAAMKSGAVDAIPSSVLLEFSIPGLFELLVKEPIDMLERNVLGSAAFWWHVHRIRDRHCKDAAQAIMAHPMCTCKFRRLDDWYVRATSEAGHFLYLSYRRNSKQT